MRVLFVSVFAPSPLRPRTREYLCWLTERFTTDCIVQDVDDRRDDALLAKTARRLILPPETRPRFLARLAADLPLRRPLSYFYYFSAALERALQTIQPEEYDLIVCERLPLPQRLVDRCRAAGTPLLLDVSDSFAFQSLALARLTKGWKRNVYRRDARLTRTFEAENANRADLVLCTTDREARKLRRLGVAQPIYASHLIVPRGDFAEPVHREKLGEGICFHGKHRYPPNADALARLWRWCQRDHALRRRLTVIGTIDNRMRARFPGVTFTGYVDSLAQTLATHRLSIAPLRVSVGLPTKAVEAIYAGLPVLVTPAVYGGLPNARRYRNQCVFVATLDQFAGALDALYSNEVALQNAGRRLAEYRRELIDSAHDGLCQALVTLKLLPGSTESSTDLASAAHA